jgi:hypothetical protein
MHVKRVRAKNFRRFADLEIVDLPPTTKLVIVAGPNGNGKSSLFDIFLRFKYRRIGYFGWAPLYHARLQSPDSPNPSGDDIDVEFHEAAGHDTHKFFYVRTAYRNEPEFGSSQISAPVSTLFDHRLGRTIDNDVTVAKNFQLLYAQGLEDAFEKLGPETTLGHFREATIGTIRQNLARILPTLHLDSLGNPFKTQSFRFSKGNIRGFNYMNLSGGEKAAFDLILDYIVKKVEFDDTIFCIDEPEAHLNPCVHAEMLSCLFDLTEDKSQLWLATHSIGMLRRARDLYWEHPGKVAFLDFEKDFDQSQIVTPIFPDRAFWQRSLSIALDDLANLVSPHQIIACESGTKDGAPGEGFDADIYNRIFEKEFPETRFVSIGSSSDMKGNRFLVVQAVANLVKGTEVLRLIDRDGRSDGEIEELETNNYRVLRRRHLEAYLLDDEVLKALCAAVGKPDQEVELLAAKAEAIEAAVKNGHDRDDIKKAAGRICEACRKVLQLQNAGRESRAFMRDTLAPLITPSTGIYDELKGTIFKTSSLGAD